MMSLEQIKDVSRDAAAAAAESGKYPFVIEAEDVGKIEALKGIPFLGDHLPKGWKRVKICTYAASDPQMVIGLALIAQIAKSRGAFLDDNGGFGAFFVDKGGWGAEGEAAFTVEEFLKYVWPGFGWGIVEEGQFQIKIGVFERIH